MEEKPFFQVPIGEQSSAAHDTIDGQTKQDSDELIKEGLALCHCFLNESGKTMQGYLAKH
jgi:hypothetical protein